MLFFFYGTLLDGSDNAIAAWVHERLQAVGPATVEGILEAVPDPDGWYPALLAGDGQVHGRLYESVEGFGAADLARLDAYENYDPARPDRSLYLRETCTATAPDGTLCEAQAYRFNRPLPDGSHPIPSGDFRSWLEEQGVRAFGGLRE
ncbi:MAG: gamma-glutamylcyclotransferase family protein [Novosphingobium sp.]|nr:gamma-glutamylcyclotransferase [Novosphingobium sp.]